MKSFQISPLVSRRLVDPVFKQPKVERHVFFCNVADLPEDIPTEPNPRSPRVDRSIWKEIERHLLNEEGVPNSFHLKNKGITILATEVEKLGNDRFEVYCKPGEGIVDGGHTYALLLKNASQVKALSDDPNADFNQFVKLEIVTGIDDETAMEMAGGLNTAIQVQRFSLENLKHEFDWIQKRLAGQPFADKIAYSENENKPYDVRDILLLLDIFNIKEFPNDRSEYPTRAYNNKGKVLDHYISHREQYEALSGILLDILALHDIIALEGRERHNEAGGRGGRLAFVEAKARGLYEFPFTGKQGKYRLHRGAIFPMLGAFRWMVEEDPKSGKLKWTGGFSAVKKVWSAAGGDLMQATQQTSDELGRKLTAIGKSKNHWANLHNIVAKHQLMAMRRK